nr:hypothetical protein Iba_scaffold13252CG0100 [Ipomoea batatas]GME19920.1 hypothetical protein Iba_scaffold24080CG0020 [Ipomoea batatas]
MGGYARLGHELEAQNRPGVMSRESQMFKSVGDATVPRDPRRIITRCRFEFRALLINNVIVRDSGCAFFPKGHSQSFPTSLLRLTCALQEVRTTLAESLNEGDLALISEIMPEEVPDPGPMPYADSVTSVTDVLPAKD